MMRISPISVCLSFLLLGCSSTSDPATGDLWQDLRHGDPRVRMQSAFRAAEENRVDLIGELVGNLDDGDESVRFVTAIALHRLTGQDFGYRSFATIPEREQAVGRWREWLGTAARPAVPGDRRNGSEGGPEVPQARRDHAE